MLLKLPEVLIEGTTSKVLPNSRPSPTVKFVAPPGGLWSTHNSGKPSNAGGQLENGLGSNLSLFQILWGSNLTSEMETSI